MTHADVRLVEACAAGDADSLRVFRDRFAPLIRRAGGRVLPDSRLDAFESEVLAHLLLPREGRPVRVAQYSGRGKLDNFVRMVASRLAFAATRRVPKPHDAGREDPGVEYLLDAENPETRALSAEHGQVLRDHLVRAVQTLETPERRALRFRFQHGFSVARTAEALGVHEGSVTRLVRRARQKVFTAVCETMAQDGLDPLGGAWPSLQAQLDLSLTELLCSEAPLVKG